MEFEYKDKIYDTAVSEGEHSTNRLQLTEDEDLKRALVNAYWNELTVKDFELDFLFQQAINNARFVDILNLTNSAFSKPGVYPDWIVKEIDNHEKENFVANVKDAIEETTTREELVEYLLGMYGD